MNSLPMVFTAQRARRAGFSDAQIRRRVANRDWVPLRRGIYCTRQTRLRSLDDAELAHLIEVAAATVAVHQPSWASHSSARRMRRLPSLAADPEQVELTVLPDADFKRSRCHDRIDVLPASVPTHHQAWHRGVPLLAVPRTVVDTARSHDLAEGLIVADAALHLGQTELAELDSVAADCAGWPGIVAARRVVEHACSKRESPLESRSFAFFIEQGLPLPECQVDVFAPDGRLIGRVDFYWRGLRLVGEADGKVKYVESFDDGVPREERLWRERLRHDDLDDAGHSIVRWTHRNLTVEPLHTRDRMLRAFDRAVRRQDR